MKFVITEDCNTKWFNEHFKEPSNNDYEIHKLEVDTVNSKYVFYGEDAELMSDAINESLLGNFITKPITLSDGTIRTFNTNYIVSVRYNYYGA